MAANIHLRAVEEDFEVLENVEPAKVNLTTVRIDEKNTRKGVIKLSLSVAYFFALVYFLVELLA
jgi:hypothetical protein